MNNLIIEPGAWTSDLTSARMIHWSGLSLSTLEYLRLLSQDVRNFFWDDYYLRFNLEIPRLLCPTTLPPPPPPNQAVVGESLKETNMMLIETSKTMFTTTSRYVKRLDVSTSKYLR